MPWEMLGSTDNEYIDLNELLSIEGVERVSPVVQFDAEIKFGEYKLNCQVQSVHNNFLDVELTEGAVYSDDSNMPFLLLNEAAAKSFSSDNNTEITIVANTNITMVANNEEYDALICGIFDNDNEVPVVYMSYDYAQKTLAPESETSLLFALSNKGYSEHVALSLKKEGIAVSYEENDMIRWTFMKQQVIQFILICVGFLACSAIMIKKQINVENKMETQALLMSGLTTTAVINILRNRLVILYIICVSTSFLVAGIFGVSSIVTVPFCLVVSLLHYWSIRF